MTQTKECRSPKLVAEANVTVSIKGLAISNYNENNRNWETVFLRHVEHHNLKITVNKCRSGNLESSQSYNVDPNDKIYISSSDTFEQPSRYTEQNDKNLSRVMDFSAADMYDGRIKFYRNSGAKLTFLSISGSIFYTKKLSKNTYDIVKAQKIKQKKKIGLVIGADIGCRIGGQTEISVEGKPNLIAPLVAEENVVYEIVFDNDCYEPAQHPDGDFSKYYDLIDESEHFSLELAKTEESEPIPTTEDPEPEPPEKNPPCNATTVSELEEGMESLSELLD
ncbi:MAG TPA: hypothetical protein VNI84_16115 [Pyrinomonadaceae bacterium]|nr:hypothetical protein [Pyrinomonadaceae bacterium]